jgi:peroxiredoxin
VPTTPSRPQPASPPDQVLTLRLDPAQELVYRGAFTETHNANGVEKEQSFRVESRVFVLDGVKGATEVALFTMLKPRSATGRGPSPGPGSVRLEIGRVDNQGQLLSVSGASLLAPLSGPPTLECGAFVPLPGHKVGEAQPWQAHEDGRPARTWELVGSEVVNGNNCLKLVGAQQSADWEQPRGDRPAWKRVDTVWLSKSGFAYKVERSVEHRVAAKTQPVTTSVLRYELESRLPYTRQLYEDCRQEVQQAREFGETLQQLLPRMGKCGPQLELLASRIKKHVESAAPTPYREAVLQVQRQVEAAQRGEMPPPVVAVTHEEVEPAPAPAAVGTLAPDFAAPSFGGSKPEHLRRWRGKPILMVFYQPNSASAADVLRFAQGIQNAGKDAVVVLGMALGQDAQLVTKQRDEMKLTFPLLDGSGLRQSYAVDGTPKILVIDAGGVMRGCYTGWGSEIPKMATDELRRWVTEPAVPK